jgi:CheY-like chemotaxis protein
LIVARILLVDDEPKVLKLFDKILTRGGHSVVSTNSGSSALEILKTAAPIDLMVLDLSMPKPDGFEVLKAVRAKWPGLRILVISGWMEGALLKPAKILGATFSLSKTDAPKLLLETVNKILQ